MVRRRKGRITRLRKVQKRCPHTRLHYEEKTGYVCDVCGTTLSTRDVKLRQAKWMLFLGPDPAGRGRPIAMSLGIGPPKK